MRTFNLPETTLEKSETAFQNCPGKLKMQILMLLTDHLWCQGGVSQKKVCHKDLNEWKCKQVWFYIRKNRALGKEYVTGEWGVKKEKTQ